MKLRNTITCKANHNKTYNCHHLLEVLAPPKLFAAPYALALYSLDRQLCLSCPSCLQVHYF